MTKLLLRPDSQHDKLQSRNSCQFRLKLGPNVTQQVSKQIKCYLATFQYLCFSLSQSSSFALFKNQLPLVCTQCAAGSCLPTPTPETHLLLLPAQADSRACSVCLSVFTTRKADHCAVDQAQGFTQLQTNFQHDELVAQYLKWFLTS